MIWFKLREIPSQSAEMQINGQKGLKMHESEWAREASCTRWFGGVIARIPPGIIGNKPKSECGRWDGAVECLAAKKSDTFPKTAKRTLTDGRFHFTLRDTFSLNTTRSRSRVLSTPLIPVPSLSCSACFCHRSNIRVPLFSVLNAVTHFAAFATVTKTTFQHELE